MYGYAQTRGVGLMEAPPSDATYRHAGHAAKQYIILTTPQVMANRIAGYIYYIQATAPRKKFPEQASSGCVLDWRPGPMGTKQLKEMWSLTRRREPSASDSCLHGHTKPQGWRTTQRHSDLMQNSSRTTSQPCLPLLKARLQTQLLITDLDKERDTQYRDAVTKWKRNLGNKPKPKRRERSAFSGYYNVMLASTTPSLVRWLARNKKYNSLRADDIRTWLDNLATSPLYKDFNKIIKGDKKWAELIRHLYAIYWNTRSLVDVNTIYRQRNKQLVNDNVSLRLQANGKVSLTVLGDGDVEMDDGGNVPEDKNDYVFDALCNI
ncbi:hypothetical protein K504DRAFT_445481 [Pleomassaria siparia CBS 279.74]|uniref:Uncharacterized protein n=1 Tax=Pleomassaria siparia CBS 279.74 TaxID=1314801 RepID=A0A6G1KNS3_9PLEO|nr:hypothetical protein K504DRAFT_445481 [Pleomassaria siparia CBS 279.74]